MNDEGSRRDRHHSYYTPNQRPHLYSTTATHPHIYDMIANACVRA